jgi:Glycosyltransferase
MKLLQLMAGSRQGGAENFFSRLAVALNRENILQEVAIRNHVARARSLKTNGIIVHELPFRGWPDLYTRWRLRKIASSFKPDIVMSWMKRASSAAPAGTWVNVGRLGGYYNLKYYKKCHYLVCNAAGICDYVINNGWSRERIFYLPNFIDEKRMPPVRRSQFNTPEDVRLIVSCGRLHDNKAFDTLITALTRIDHAYLWIVGDGPLADKLIRQVSGYELQDRVRFLGWREDVAAIHATADVFVCPSRHEPFGNVILEAWAHETPIVATAAEGPVELITNGVNGLLVPIDDPEKLADAINKLLHNAELAAKLSRNGHDHYLKNFSEDVVVGRYLDFFEKIISAKQRALS